VIRSLWISKTGLDAQQQQLDVVANNLANVGTTGFKRARVAFEDLLDGSTGYTRDGSFHVNSNGQIVTSAGFALQPAITVPANAVGVTVGQDGTVTAALAGQPQPQNIGSIQLASFQNPAGLESRGQNLFAETAASGNPNTNTPGTNGMGTLQQGYLETSNVNVVEELVSMIQTQRAYEINSKAIQTSDQILGRLAQI